MSENLFEKTYQLCQKWQLRQFTVREKFKDTFQEIVEVFEAIFKREGKENIGLEYGDVIFTVARHGKDERVRPLRRMLFVLFPGKVWLERKLKVFDKRHRWWMKNHGIHTIRNYENKEKREKIIKERC